MQSPQITAHDWGYLHIDGFGDFKDAKLSPGAAQPWDWNETGTRHRPGIQIADVIDLLDEDVRTVVLSRGRHERLEVPDETIDWLTSQGIEVHVLETERAIETYNALAQSRPIAALIHSTC